MILRVLKPIRENPLNALLPLALVAVILNALDISPMITLIVSAIAMIPMAGLIGEATEAIAAMLGPRLSGLLNATFGNAAEFIISIVLVVHHKAWPIRRALLVLLGSTAGVVWLSEILVRHIESATVNLDLSEFFLGVIIVPIIGNVA